MKRFTLKVSACLRVLLVLPGLLIAAPEMILAQASLTGSPLPLPEITKLLSAKTERTTTPSDAAIPADVTPENIPESTETVATTSVSPVHTTEKNFLKNLLSDQRDIWTMPFRMRGRDARWVLPLSLSTAALIATDRHSAMALNTQGNYRTSRVISGLGSSYAMAGLSATMYLTGRATKNDRLRETGMLSAEALINSCLVYGALKQVTQRARPLEGNRRGGFLDGGSSFPSGHAASVWSVAVIVASEYKDRPLVKWSAYGLATAVTASRFTGHKHYLSDLVIGSAIGMGIGRYVFHRRHNSELDVTSATGQRRKSQFIPTFAPQVAPGAGVYGLSLSWGGR